MHSRQLYSDPPPSSSIVQKHSAAATSFSYRSFLLSFDVQVAFTSILSYSVLFEFMPRCVQQRTYRGEVWHHLHLHVLVRGGVDR